MFQWTMTFFALVAFLLFGVRGVMCWIAGNRTHVAAGEKRHDLILGGLAYIIAAISLIPITASLWIACAGKTGVWYCG